MKALLIETATDVCSTACCIDGELMGEVISGQQFQHASHLTLFIQESLAAAGISPQDLDYVVVSDGPGSYTSLRVGAATAKGLCVALPGLLFTSMATLKSLAYGASTAAATIGAAFILPAIASRRDEVYTRAYRNWQTPVDELRSEVLTPSSFANLRGNGKILICGSGTEKIREVLGDADDLVYHPEVLCRAANLIGPFTAFLAAGQLPSDVATYEPTYLKPPFVTKSTKKLL